MFSSFLLLFVYAVKRVRISDRNLKRNVEVLFKKKKFSQLRSKINYFKSDIHITRVLFYLYHLKSVMISLYFNLPRNKLIFSKI